MKGLADILHKIQIGEKNITDAHSEICSLFNVSSSSDEPENCTKEYKEDTCDECPFNEYVMVGHPGGSRVHSVEKHHCELGHWEDDF